MAKKQRKYIAHKDGVQVYRDRHGELRWRVWHRGRNTANSGEGYKRKAALLRAMKSSGLVLTSGVYTTA